MKVIKNKGLFAMLGENEKIPVFVDNSAKYRSALEEVREIAKSIYQICDDECGNASRLKLITDKINEVLNG